MAVNYLHRLAGEFPGRGPGYFYRFPPDPEFVRKVREDIPEIQYRYEWRAFWVPTGQAPRFDQRAFDQGITPCGRCRRGEECTAWTTVGAQGSQKSGEDADFERQAADWFRREAERVEAEARKWEQARAYGYSPHDDKTDAYSYATQPPHQHTYGRRVDPPVDEQRERVREERERRRRASEPPVQQPPDVRARAAALLGVAVGAGANEVKRAVHRLAMEHHPDRGGSGDMMAKVLNARDVMLGREFRRARR